jgi:cleavage and polyadenylation specificity factor subunit 1
MAQIYPIWDEDEGDERFAVSASFADPYLLIIRDDSSVLLLHSDESGDLDELSKPDTISSQSWLCGCLYTDKHSVFEEGNTTQTTYMFLLNQECKLFVSATDLQRCKWHRLLIPVRCSVYPPWTLFV